MSIPPSPSPLTGISLLKVILIIPDDDRRRTFARLLATLNVAVIKECTDYPNDGTLKEVVDLACDVFIVDLTTNADLALQLIESICSHSGLAIVMACSSGTQPDLLLRSMRAGAREYLVEPVLPAVITEALLRTLVRRENLKPQKAAARVVVFVSTKGGAGNTTIATNFAVALAEENVGKVVAMDLDLQLGEMALDLGISQRFSLVDALDNIDHLDSVFLLSLLAKHSSGLFVLAAPERFSSHRNFTSGLDRVLRLLRDEFTFVVIDAGPIPGNEEFLLSIADTVYLVTEASIPALRNARRMLTFIGGMDNSPRTEIVLNRFNSKILDIDEISVAKALARPVSWRVPNDFAAVRNAQNTGIPVAMSDSPITRVLHRMTRQICGKPAAKEKKGKSMFSLFE